MTKWDLPKRDKIGLFKPATMSIISIIREIAVCFTFTRPCPINISNLPFHYRLKTKYTHISRRCAKHDPALIDRQSRRVIFPFVVSPSGPLEHLQHLAVERPIDRHDAVSFQAIDGDVATSGARDGTARPCVQSNAENTIQGRLAGYGNVESRLTREIREDNWQGIMCW